MFMTGVDLGPRKEQMEIENKKRECCVAFSSFFSAKKTGLGLGVFFDGKFTSVVSAFGTYVVIHDLGTAVAASGELCFFQAVVRSSLGRSGL